MRRLPLLLLAGVLVGACNDPSGPSGGALLVSTSMTGTEPDEDGYVLLVNGEPVLTLDANDSQVVELDGGTHTLDLQGLDPHCTVEPALPFEVRVSGGERVPLSLAVDCPPTGAIVTAHFTGIDIPTFYRVAVDGVAQNSVVTTASTTLARLGPGEHTVELLPGPTNCAPDGPSSRTVTVIAGAFVPLDFAVRCTASTGVIKVVVNAGGEDIGFDYGVAIDGFSRSFTMPDPFHLSGVAGGEHTVALSVPANCVVEGDPRSVAVEVGGLVRDTAEISFAVTCARLRATLRVVTTTSGRIPAAGYAVYLHDYYYPISLGTVPPSGALEVELRPGTYLLTVNQPVGCAITPAPEYFTIEHGQVLELPFAITCAP